MRGTGPPTLSAVARFVSGELEARAETLWKSWESSGQIQGSFLATSRVPEYLRALGVPDRDTALAMRSLADQRIGTTGLNLEQAVGLCSTIELNSPRMPSPPLACSSSMSISKSPLKKVLSKNRAYLGTGHLVYDETVLDYIRKLEEHRKRCEAEGRYSEAKAATIRLAELKTAQVERLREVLVDDQIRELAEVQSVYEEETNKFSLVWRGRIEDHEASFGTGAEEMRLAHREVAQRLADDLSQKQFKVMPSREYLEQKRMEASMVKTREYSRATKVQRATEQMLALQTEQVAAASEADQRIKMAKLAAKQMLEAEVLASRSFRGRDELERRRTNETERRSNRYRNVVKELESLHRLEIVSLENFLDGQVKAGKAAPLKDGFRRKREQLLNTQF